MAIRIYNTLSKNKEPFEPLQPGKVGIYLCGPTVYKPSHIGHMVGPVIFDTIKRYLVYCGFDVTLVINVTDIDDKLINESRTRGMTMPELAREMTDDYMANLQAMGVETVDHFPRATDNIEEIIALTRTLVDGGFAYVAAGGDVYFEVGKDPEYGKLSHRSVEALVGEGGDMADRKRSAADFALWKGAKPGEPSWPSPWGPGRPGWHIECSAMSRRLLGESFDIHGGGLDLVFPHHENEIAQSECCHGKPQAKYWLHNGLMQAADEVGKVGGRNTRTAADGDDRAEQEAGKMGKSKGASAFRDLLQQYSAETIRFFLLSTHYRRPIYYSAERLDEVGTSLATFYRFFERFARVAGSSFYELQPPVRRGAQHDAKSLGAAERERYLETMDDDFNTGGAIGVLFDLVRLLNKFVDENKLEERDKQTPELMGRLREGALTLRELSAILGLFREPVVQADAAGGDDLADGLMQLIIEIRAESRKKKDFATADKIRDALTALRVTLEDRPDGTGWKRAAP
ncbi:MAG: cysteine--tRNA ligase [Pirellulales bacterium]|nr:cysteine--tRNA ligase [Pirellulales bacterium]